MEIKYIIDKIEKKQGTGEGCWNDINLDIKVKELQLLERIGDYLEFIFIDNKTKR